MKRFIALGLVILMVFSLCACSNQAASTPTPDQAETTPTPTPTADNTPKSPLEGLVIGNSIVHKSDEFQAVMADTFEAMAKEYGCEMVVEDPSQDVEKQVKQIEDMIARKVDAIFVCPITMDSLNDVLQKAVDAGIPVFTYQGEPSYETAEFHITWDQYSTGIETGNYVKDWVEENLDGSAKCIILTTYISRFLAQRAEGFRDATKDTNITVEYEVDCDISRELAYNTVMNYVDDFDIVIAAFDNLAWGAVSAIQARGLDAKVFSMGMYGDESFRALRDKNETFAAGCVVDPVIIAEKTFESYIDFLANGRAEGDSIADRCYKIDLYMADQNNINDLYDFPNG